MRPLIALLAVATALAAQPRRIVSLAACHPVPPEPSFANYLYARQPYPADGLAETSVRVAVRNRAENDRLIAAWKEFECAR